MTAGFAAAEVKVGGSAKAGIARAGTAAVAADGSAAALSDQSAAAAALVAAQNTLTAKHVAYVGTPNAANAE
jgi:hypothetical protein